MDSSKDSEVAVNKARLSKEEKRALTERYKSLFIQVRVSVNKWDPYGFLAMGCPPDEYRGEIGALLLRLKEITSLELANHVVLGVFEDFIGTAGTDSRDACSALAVDIWEICREYAGRLP